MCCEINSAIHVRDDRIVTSLVNSLFGDGCGAVLLATNWKPAQGPELDRAIPTLLGEHSPIPISALLDAFGLCRCDVSHWLRRHGHDGARRHYRDRLATLVAVWPVRRDRERDPHA